MEGGPGGPRGGGRGGGGRGGRVCSVSLSSLYSEKPHFQLQNVLRLNQCLGSGIRIQENENGPQK
jgi:hypothetical protein